MGAEVLSSRAVIGTFYELLEQNVGNTWIDAVSNLFDSDQAKETYPWIGMVPTLREWIGGRHAKGFNSADLEIENLHFEATIEVLVKELRRDNRENPHQHAVDQRRVDGLVLEAADRAVGAQQGGELIGGHRGRSGGQWSA